MVLENIPSSIFQPRMDNATKNPPPKIIRSVCKLLTFCLSQAEFLRLGNRHFALGLFCTWVVGMGRYWDDSGANLLQHLGVGSVIYIFVLSLLLWLIIWPLKPQSWSYRHVLTFISLTSPPAILYAIPVERFYSLETARTMNLWFLAAVATWRVALLFFYLKRHAQLEFYSIIIAAMLPIMSIIVTLTALNLERAVFDFMGGLREPGTANDDAYAVLTLLTLFSVILFIPFLVGYLFLVYRAFYPAIKIVTLNLNAKENQDK